MSKDPSLSLGRTTGLPHCTLQGTASCEGQPRSIGPALLCRQAQAGFKLKHSSGGCSIMVSHCLQPHLTFFCRYQLNPLYVLITVVAYMMKDRMKEWGKRYLQPVCVKFGFEFPDRIVKVRHPPTLMCMYAMCLLHCTPQMYTGFLLSATICQNPSAKLCQLTCTTCLVVAGMKRSFCSPYFHASLLHVSSMTIITVSFSPYWHIMPFCVLTCYISEQKPSDSC